MAQILLTPATLLSILVQIDELQNKDIQLSENPDGSLGLSIGTSDYHIHPDTIIEVPAAEQYVEDVEDANESEYQDLADAGEVELSSDVVEGGVLKELAKTLLVGGLIRLSDKLLHKDKR